MGTLFAIVLITGVVIMFADGIRGCLKWFIGSFLVTVASLFLFGATGVLIGILAMIGLAVYQIFYKRKITA